MRALVARTHLERAHATACEALGHLGLRVPGSLDVLAAARRNGAVASQDDVRAGCRALDLPLADADHSPPPRLTRGWPWP